MIENSNVEWQINKNGQFHIGIVTFEPSEIVSLLNQKNREIEKLKEQLEAINKEQPEKITFPDGREYWYTNGKLHKDDGPAVIFPDGTEYWYTNGRLHRTDGPAVIYPDGTEAWYTNGKRTDPVRNR